MIEFYGEISDECKLIRARKISRNNGILFSLITTIVGIIALVFCIFNNDWYYTATLIIIFFVVMIIAFATPKETLAFKVVSRLIITNNSISITCLGGNDQMKTKSLKSVKKVIDAGEWYDIIFKFGDISNSWVCQKNLIVQGTIEDFEKLFADKIKRVKIK